MKRLTAVALGLWAASAYAWPVDVIHDVELGRERFVKVASLEWFDVEDPRVASVELMESGEVLISGLKPGRTLVLLFAEGRFALWRVRVGGQPVLAGDTLAAALKACPGMAYRPDAVDKLTGEVKSDACRKALLPLLMTDALVARDLDFTFDAAMLQAQLKEAQRTFSEQKLNADLHYEGATLVLKGALPLPKLKKVLWELFRRSVGRVLLDDQLDPVSPLDGGPRSP